MDRRDFLKSAAFLSAFGLVSQSFSLYASGMKAVKPGSKWGGWKKGHFQVHFIYTGVAESIFFIFPDGTTMLLDCGDHNAVGRGELAVPVLPGAYRHAGEWVARYVKKVNPHKNKVDYMMLSHYHNDHSGCQTFYSDIIKRGGKDYVLSGFSQAAQYLHFDKAIDRCWPDYNDPLPLKENPDEGFPHMKNFYDYMQEHRGMEIEKFRLGEVNQIKQLHDPQSYPDFFIRNICANGRICGEDGVVRDLYRERITKQKLKSVSENGMSLGMIIGYGPFRFFTAGDFSDRWNLEDGSVFRIEDALAEICPKVDVAKLNHHGHNSMPRKLVKALSARVWVSCVWDQLHNLDAVMSRLADQSLYAGDRIICPGVMPVERRNAAKGREWLDYLDKSSFEGGHIVLDVEPGGEEYSITYLSADDESLNIRSVMTFQTR